MKFSVKNLGVYRVCLKHVDALVTNILLLRLTIVLEMERRRVLMTAAGSSALGPARPDHVGPGVGGRLDGGRAQATVDRNIQLGVLNVQHLTLGHHVRHELLPPEAGLDDDRLPIHRNC